MSYDYSGKVVIVTGSTSGIGEDAAIEFSRSGAQVVVTGRNEAGAEVVADKCKNVSPKGLEPLIVIADVSKEEGCVKIIEQTIKQFTQLDVLVNNAGMVKISNLASKDLLPAYDTIFATNVRSALTLTSMAVPHLAKTRGVIVNISSVASLTGSDYSTPYHMSKAAIDSMTKCSAIELGPKGIRVVSVVPASIDTPIFVKSGWGPEIMKQMNKQYPVGRIGNVSETSAAILFAASKGASFITGSSLLVDGGLLAGQFSTATTGDATK